MSENTTLARPYAKAIFAHALAVEELRCWSELLHTMAFIVSDKNARQFFTNPAVTDTQQVDLLMSPLTVYSLDTTIKAAVKNLLHQLIHNKRLMLLPEINKLYTTMRAEREKTLQVCVRSYQDLTPTQQKQLSDSLGCRLQRQVTIKITIDKSLLGGAIIQAGDLVIDGSVRGKLNKLNAALAA